MARHRILLAALTGVLAAFPGAGWAGNGILHGEILDKRITACGVRIEGERIARLTPFIATSAPLSGTYRASIRKKAASGSSLVSQGSTFSAGSLGDPQIAVDRPSEVSVQLSVEDADGRPLCRLDATTVLEGPQIRT